MAIIKKIDTKFGVTAEYHRISKVLVDSTSGEVTIWLDIFSSQDSRDSGKDPLYTETVKIPFYLLNKDPREPFYDLLQSHSSSPLIGGTGDTEVSDLLSFGYKELPPPPPTNF